MSGVQMVYDTNYTRPTAPQPQYYTPVMMMMPAGYLPYLPEQQFYLPPSMQGGYYLPPSATYAPLYGGSTSAGAGAPGSYYGPYAHTLGAYTSAGAGGHVIPYSPAEALHGPTPYPPGGRPFHPHHPQPGGAHAHLFAASNSVADSDRQPHITPGTQTLGVMPSHFHHSRHSRHSGNHPTGISDVMLNLNTEEWNIESALKAGSEDGGFQIDQIVEQVPQQIPEQVNPRMGLRKKKQRRVCGVCNTPHKKIGCQTCLRR